MPLFILIFFLKVYEVTIIAEDEDSFDEDTETTDEVFMIICIYIVSFFNCIVFDLSPTYFTL